MSVAMGRTLLPRTTNEFLVGGVSSFVKGGVMLLLTACIDLGVAFSTPYWATWTSSARHVHGGYGLWQSWKCPETDPPPDQPDHTAEGCQVKWANTSFPVWYMATQVCMTLGMVGLLASMVMLLLYIFLARCSKNKVIMDAVIGTSYTAAFFILVGLCVFGWRVVDGMIPNSRSEWFLSWSFSLACTAFVLNAVSASILVTESKRLHRKEYRRQKAATTIVTSGYVRLTQPGDMGELSQSQQIWGQFITPCPDK